MLKARAVACCCALALPLIAATLPAGAEPIPTPSALDRDAAAHAVAWIETQQQPDGGFEVAGSPGFETRDAALAIAEAAQTGPTWSSAEALAAVSAVKRGGHSALDALDTLAHGPLTAGGAAKLIVLTTAPLGLDPTAFDPTGTLGATDLVATVDAGAQADGSYGTFSDTLYAALAQKLTSGSVPTATLADIRARQQANGGWGFAGDAAGTDVDPDTTGLAVEALVGAGAGGSAPAGDAAVRKALAFFAAQHGSDGSWRSPFDAGNPNSTALAMVAVDAAGFDTTSACWRDTFAPTRANVAYVPPDAYLRAQQAPDGHVASPNDSFGLNTFATSQAVEGLLLSWLPVTRATTQPCSPPTTTTTAPATVLGQQAQTGAADDGTTASGELPNTGPRPVAWPLGAVGAAVLVLGAALVAATRRRAERPDA